MYILGVDIPLVELILAMGVVGIIILFEITVILLLMTYHMRNEKRLEEQIANLVSALTRLNQQEFRELNKIREVEEKGLSFAKHLDKSKSFKPKR